jgi:hypothetical protein
LTFCGRCDTGEAFNHDIGVDVHAVCPDPLPPGHLVAVTGRGCDASEDGGATWEKRMQGIDRRYTVGLHVNPARAGELLVTAGDGAPGVNGGIDHSRHTGRQWQAVAHAGRPDRYARVPVVFFTDGAAWVATHEGQIFRAEDVPGEWSLRGELPATIHAVAADGCPTAVDAGHRREMARPASSCSRRARAATVMRRAKRPIESMRRWAVVMRRAGQVTWPEGGDDVDSTDDRV